MNLSREAKVAVWLVLLLGLGTMVYFRRDSIWLADISPAEKGLLAMFGLLLLWPLFTEIDFFGLKVKQELEVVRQELRREQQKRFEVLQQIMAAPRAKGWDPSVNLGMGNHGLIKPSGAPVSPGGEGVDDPDGPSFRPQGLDKVLQ